MTKPTNQVRIIAGQWRGNRLSVPNIEGLRPTPDRVRETLFNWLADHCPGARVLDCFAGSGALGFEAASRGARQVYLVEKNQVVLDHLVQQKQRFQADHVDVRAGDVTHLMPDLPGGYTVVFIDPPYRKPELRIQALEDLINTGKLASGAQIYFEWPKHEIFELPGSQLSWRRQKRAGQIQYAIAEWSPNDF